MIQITFPTSTSSLKTVREVINYFEFHVSVQPAGVVRTEFSHRKYLERPKRLYEVEDYFDVILSEDNFVTFAEFFGMTEEQAFHDFNAEVIA